MSAPVSQEQLARIDEILCQLDQQQGPDPADNRRRARRMTIRIRLAATTFVAGRDAPLTVFTRNLSTSGVAFVSRRMFRFGERLALAFRLPDRAPKLVLAQVTFSRYLSAGLYECGAEFIESAAPVDGKESIPPHWIATHAAKPATEAAAPKPAPHSPHPPHAAPPPPARASKTPAPKTPAPKVPAHAR